MTATSHRIFNLSAAIALSFHWWVWLLFFLAASLPDQLEPATSERSRFRSHRGFFHTYAVWILLGLTIFWLPATVFTVRGIPLLNAAVKCWSGSFWPECCVTSWPTLPVAKGALSCYRATVGNWDTAVALGMPVGYRSNGIVQENFLS